MLDKPNKNPVIIQLIFHNFGLILDNSLPQQNILLNGNMTKESLIFGKLKFGKWRSLLTNLADDNRFHPAYKMKTKDSVVIQ